MRARPIRTRPIRTRPIRARPIRMPRAAAWRGYAWRTRWPALCQRAGGTDRGSTPAGRSRRTGSTARTRRHAVPIAQRNRRLGGRTRPRWNNLAGSPTRSRLGQLIRVRRRPAATAAARRAPPKREHRKTRAEQARMPQAIAPRQRHRACNGRPTAASTGRLRLPSGEGLRASRCRPTARSRRVPPAAGPSTSAPCAATACWSIVEKKKKKSTATTRLHRAHGNLGQAAGQGECRSVTTGQEIGTHGQRRPSCISRCAATASR